MISNRKWFIQIISKFLTNLFHHRITFRSIIRKAFFTQKRTLSQWEFHINRNTMIVWLSPLYQIHWSFQMHFFTLETTLCFFILHNIT